MANETGLVGKHFAPSPFVCPKEHTHIHCVLRGAKSRHPSENTLHQCGQREGVKTQDRAPSPKARCSKQGHPG
eukprot:1150273-Pelagomonas_calceolata.AAC.5